MYRAALSGWGDSPRDDFVRPRLGGRDASTPEWLAPHHRTKRRSPTPQEQLRVNLNLISQSIVEVTSALCEALTLRINRETIVHHCIERPGTSISPERVRKQPFLERMDRHNVPMCDTWRVDDLLVSWVMYAVKSHTLPPKATAMAWWPRHTPSTGIVASRMRSNAKPISC